MYFIFFLFWFLKGPFAGHNSELTFICSSYTEEFIPTFSLLSWLWRSQLTFCHPFGDGLSFLSRRIQHLSASGTLWFPSNVCEPHIFLFIMLEILGAS